MTETQTTITLGSVRVTDAAVTELSGGTPAVQIPTADITQIELKRTIGAERPLLLLLFGILLTVPGFYFTRILWSWLLFGGTLLVDVTLSFLLLIPVGLWIAITAFRRRVLLHVYTSNDKRKLVFKGKHTQEELRTFIGKIRERLSCPVRDLLRK